MVWLFICNEFLYLQNKSWNILFLHFYRRGIDFLTKMLTAVGNKIIMETQLNKIQFVYVYTVCII